MKAKSHFIYYLCGLSSFLISWIGDRLSVCHAQTIQVYILCGQSNAVGYNSTDTYTPAPFPDSLRNQPNIMFWPGSNAVDKMRNVWISLRVGVSGIGENAFGPEISFGHDISVANPEIQVAIIKYAVGASGIARSKDYSEYIPGFEEFNDNRRNWCPPKGNDQAGILYQNLLSNIASALSSFEKQGKKYRLAGILWMQGEHEAGISQNMAEDYQSLLKFFISSLRKDLDSPDIPVVIGQISDKWIYHEAVKLAQQKVCSADPRNMMVVTKDLPRNPNDDAHYTANGMIILGSRFAAKMLELQNSLKTNKR